MATGDDKRGRNGSGSNMGWVWGYSLSCYALPGEPQTNISLP